MDVGSLDASDDGEYDDVSVVELSEIFATQDDLFYEMTPFNREQVQGLLEAEG